MTCSGPRSPFLATGSDLTGDLGFILPCQIQRPRVSEIIDGRSPNAASPAQRPFYVCACSHCLALISTIIGSRYATTSERRDIPSSVVSGALGRSRKVLRGSICYSFLAESVPLVGHALLQPPLDHVVQTPEVTSGPPTSTLAHMILPTD